MAILSATFYPDDYLEPAAMTCDPPNLAAALRHAEAGIPVFPALVTPGATSWNKRPAIAGWQAGASTNPERIRAWWRQFPHALPGIELGRAGLVVIDADRHGDGPDGIAALAELVALHGGLPVGPIVETAGGGLHYVFRNAPADPLGNSPGSLPGGVDVRGTGGWIAAPGAVRSDGAAYRELDGAPSLAEAFAEDGDDLPVIPEWLADIIRQPRAPAKAETWRAPARPVAAPATVGDRERRYAEKALAAEAAKLASVTSGRNAALNTAAVKVGHYVGAGWIGEAEASDALAEAATANGYVGKDGARAMLATLASGLRAGMAEPAAPLPDRVDEDAEFGATIVAGLKRGERMDPETGEITGEAPATPAGDGKPQGIRPTPFVWTPPADLPPREWLYGRHLIRRFVSCTFAAGAVGKSSLLIVEALAMVTGRPLLGSSPVEPLRVWLWNGEDPNEETVRRVTAAMLHYSVPPEEVEGRLFLDSGRDLRIVLAEDGKDGTRIARPVVAELKRVIAELRIDVLVIDPFVSSHRVSENDNNAIDMVAKEWAAIAHETGCAVELVHHVRKTGGAEVTVEDGRGAGALLAAARSARVLNRMSPEEGERAGVENHLAFFRIGGAVSAGKANLTVSSPHAIWFGMRSVHLGNGGVDDRYPEGDSVGVVTTWTWPDAMAGMTTDDLLRAQQSLDGRSWRRDPQAGEWVGYPIGEALGIDVGTKAGKARVGSLLKTWIANGAFVEVEGMDAKRMKKTFVEVGEWATE